MTYLDDSDLQAFIDLSVDLLCVSTVEGNILAVNSAFRERLGYSDDAVIGQPLWFIVHPDDLERTAVEIGRVVGGETMFSFENRCLTANGQTRLLEWSARVDTERGRMYAAAQDITERIIAESDSERLSRYTEVLESNLSDLREALDARTRAANTDQLTGLLNRRGFEAVAAGELNRANRHEHAVGIAMFDVDHFKAINDEHDHAVGDREFRSELAALVAEPDCAARRDGERRRREPGRTRE
jgi:PAS domain S-box-containing protein